MKINTTPGETYIVLSTGGCTVTTGAGKQIKRLAAGQDFFTAMTGDSILSDDNASVTVAKGEILAMLNTDSTGSDVQATLRFQPVTSQSALPATGESGVIYLVPNGETAPNQYTEWVWTGAAYEQLGDVSVDLDGYASKEELGITDISEGETGPQITSNATVITKAIQVSSLEVGDFVSVTPTDDPDVNDVIISSAMVNLSTGSRIKLSDSSWLGGNQGQLGTITVMGSLQIGSSGSFGFAEGYGRLQNLSLQDSLKIGSKHELSSRGGKLSRITLVDGLQLGHDGTYGFDDDGGTLYSLAVTNWLYLGEDGTSCVDPSGNGRLLTLSVMNELRLGEKHSLNSSGSGKLNQLNLSNVETLALKSASQSPMSITGTMKWDSNAKDKAETSDFGHPLAIYADSMALGVGWAEVSYVKAMIEMETPVLKSPGGPMSIMSSLGLYTFKNASGGTEVPTLSAPSIECDDLSARNIHTDYMEIPDVDIVAKSIELAGGMLKFGTTVSEMVSCYINSGCNIEGPGWDKSFSDTYTRLGLGAGTGTGTAAVDDLSLDFNDSYGYHKELHVGRNEQDIEVRLQSTKNNGSGESYQIWIRPDWLSVHGQIEVHGSTSSLRLTEMANLNICSGSTIIGDGWDAIVADIQAGAAAAAAAVEAEQETFTKLIFPPTGTATAEQDPSWITKKNILMETSGGQLNMTHLVETLAYAAQTPLAIAKRTLWLSTSPGAGDAVQWPANAVFPDDQTQDKIQQLNSNSTYWFDITYVGGSDTVLIRKVCSWASTTGESGPTE